MIVRSGGRGVDDEISTEMWGSIITGCVALLLTVVGMKLWGHPDYTLRIAGWMVDAANLMVIGTQVVRVLTINPPTQRWLR